MIFCESVLGVNHMPYAKDFAYFGQKEQLKIKMRLKQRKKDIRLTADFTWPAIFAVSLKTQLYGYFYCKDKNLAILLTLLVLAIVP